MNTFTNELQHSKEWGLGRFVSAHLQAALFSFGHLWRASFASAMTVAVIAIALALPACLLVVLHNAKTISQGWEKGTQVSLFLDKKISPDERDTLLKNIRLRADVGYLKYISPSEGLRQLEKEGGAADVIRQLPDNPLPGVIEVYPVITSSRPEQVQVMLNELKQMPHVDVVRLDMQWLKRLYAIIKLVQKGVDALVLLLALAVVLVISNTIRLATLNRRKEIEVFKLVGATNRFIRRPFVYSGVFYGFFGGVFAWALIELLVFWTQKSVTQLAALYQSNFHLMGLGVTYGLSLLFAATALGWLGAWVAVSRHINAIDP